MQEHEKNLFSMMLDIMGKGTVVTLCLIMAGLFFVAGCKKDNPTGITGGGEEPEYPIEVPFTEYSLEGTSCQWVNLSCDDKVIIINSEEELQQYVACTDGSYSAVDFSVHTLLLANGGTANGISEIKKNLQQLSAIEYELNIEITLNDAAVAEAWTVALLVEKISEESTVNLKVNASNNEPEIPYVECTHEDAGIYMDTIQMAGTGYLFVNSIPAELQEDKDVMYIIYNKEDNLATFSVVHPTEALYNGNICNFPNFAKAWEIPAEGKQIYYKGEFYLSGEYPSYPPHRGGDLILTTLNKIEM